MDLAKCCGMQTGYAQQAASYAYGAGSQAVSKPGAIAQAAQSLAPEQQAKLSQIMAQVDSPPWMSSSAHVSKCSCFTGGGDTDRIWAE